MGLGSKGSRCQVEKHRCLFNSSRFNQEALPIIFCKLQQAFNSLGSHDLFTEHCKKGLPIPFLMRLALCPGVEDGKEWRPLKNIQFMCWLLTELCKYKNS